MTQATVYSSAVLLVRRNFRQHYALAHGIVISGYSCGLFVFSPVVEALGSAYDWRGACLLAAGFMLQTVVMGALIKERRRRSLYQEVQLDELPHADEEICSEDLDRKLRTKLVRSNENGYYMVHAASDRHLPVVRDEADVVASCHNHKDGLRVRSVSMGDCRDEKPHLNGGKDARNCVVGSDRKAEESEAAKTFLDPCATKAMAHDGSPSKSPSLSYVRLSTLPDAEMGEAGKTPEPSSYEVSSPDSQGNQGNHKLYPDCIPAEGGSIQSPNGECLSSHSLPPVDPSTQRNRLQTWLALNHHTFILYTFSAFIYTVAYSIFLLHITSALKEEGVDSESIATCYSVFAALNLAGRVGNGFLVSSGVISETNLLILSQIITMASTLVMCLSQIYMVRVVSIAVFGIATGMACSLFYPIHRQIVDPKVDVKTLAIFMFFEGLAGPTGGALGGLVRDVSGTYRATFLSSAGLALFAAFLMPPVICLNSRHKRAS